MIKPVKTTPTIEARRKDLIRGTMSSISKYGYANSTVQSICEEAGLSRGLIGHYFDGKDDLLLAAFRELTEELAHTTREVLKRSRKGPFEKLLAIADVHVDPPSGVLREQRAIWLAFWGVARWNPKMLEVHREIWGRYRRSIERLMGEAAAERELDINTHYAAITFTQLVDGLWLGWIMEQAFSSEEARQILRHWLFREFHEDPARYPERQDLNPS